MIFEDRWFQKEAVESVYRYFENGSTGNPVIAAPTGCHAIDSEILMFDGTIKKVQDIKVGDFLMGPDSKPRTVLNLARGRQEMRLITPVKGEPFVVNKDHILNVKKVSESSKKECWNCDLQRNENVSISTLENSAKYFRHVRKLRRVGVDFLDKPLPLEPYFLGLMIGDGSLANGTVTFTGSEISSDRAMMKVCKQFNLKLSRNKKPVGEAIYYRLSKKPNAKFGKRNELYLEFEKIGLGRTNSHTIFIPEIYKLNGERNRLELLAGLIDSDGYYNKRCNVYEYVTVSKQLANDVKFLARSLGFAAYVKEKDAKLYGVFKSKAYRLYISGDVDRVPVRIDYKKAKKRIINKDVLCTGFKIEKLPENDFFGFHISGDHLYLDSNFIVHHNTGKSLIIAMLATRIMREYPNQKIMMLTHVKTLIEQNAEKLQMIWPTAPIGIYSAGLNERSMLQPVIYAGVQSVYSALKKSEKKDQDTPPQYRHFGWRDIIIIDECFSPDTEILTEKGFVKFEDLDVCKVAQYDVSNEEISFTEPLHYIRKPAADGLLKIKSNKNFDLLLTPKHEMIVNSKKVKAENVVKGSNYKMPMAGKGIGVETTLESWEKLAICYQADGSLHKENINGSIIMAFSFSKERKIEKFLELMREGDFSWNEVSGKASRNVKVKARRRFMVYMPLLVSKSIEGYFSIPHLSEVKAKEIIEYMNLWDGHVATKNIYLYTTTNKKMADFYQAVATLANYRSDLTITEDNRKETFNTCYRLFVNKSSNVATTSSFEPEKIEYCGDVYCVEMPKGAIVVRRNGKVLITGNCHMLSPEAETMYQFVIGKFKEINPQLKIIGLTATPYRLKQGMITDGGIFTDICYDITKVDSFNRLIAEGYLAPLVPRPTETEIDVSSVGLVGSEFNSKQMDAVVDNKDTIYKAIKESVTYGQNRSCWIAFASSIENAEHIAEMLRYFNVNAVAVHSKNEAQVNAERMRDFKEGKITCLVSKNMLTTGFDCPQIDMIIDLRPTMSPALHVQKNGRGTRPAPGKKDCVAKGSLVLTNEGLVKIENVTTGMKVWDGVEWVSHGGAVCKGVKEVINYEGLCGTKDHKVWTKQGWKTLWECQQKQIEIAVTGNNEKAIREAENYFTGHFKKREKFKSLRENAMFRLLKTIRNGVYKFDDGESQLPSLRKSESCTEMALLKMQCCKTKMHKFKKSCLGALRRAWHKIRVFESAENGFVYSREFRFASKHGNRSNRQQQKLRTWQFKMVESFPKFSTHKKTKTECFFTSNADFASRNKICRRNFGKSRKSRFYNGRSDRKILQKIVQTKREVWDILNAGSLHRFTVNNLLVSNCVVLDFARNVPRLGPVNDPYLPKRSTKGKAGDAPIWICPACGVYNHAAARQCTNCGEVHTFKDKLFSTAGKHELIRDDTPQVSDFKVTMVFYSLHNKANSPPMMKVVYACGLRMFQEFVMLEHSSDFAAKRSRDWWRQRHNDEPPLTTHEALQKVSELRTPKSISVHINKKPYPEILQVEW